MSFQCKGCNRAFTSQRGLTLHYNTNALCEHAKSLQRSTNRVLRSQIARATRDLESLKQRPIDWDDVSDLAGPAEEPIQNELDRLDALSPGDPPSNRSPVFFFEMQTEEMASPEEEEASSEIDDASASVVEEGEEYTDIGQDGPRLDRLLLEQGSLGGGPVLLSQFSTDPRTGHCGTEQEDSFVEAERNAARVAEDHQLPCLPSEPLFNRADSVNNQRSMDPNDRALLRLYCYLRKIRAPLKAMDDLLDIFAEEMNDGFDPRTSGRRRSFISRLSKSFRTPVPRSVNVPIETPSRRDENYVGRFDDSLCVQYYDFHDLASDLLQCPSLMGSLENFAQCLNPQDHFSPFVDNGPGTDEIFSGLWYRSTVEMANRLCQANEPRMVIPIRIYMDGTGTDVNQRNSAEPMTIIFPHFAKTLRNNPYAQRVLGFVPDLERKSSAEKRASERNCA